MTKTQLISDIILRVTRGKPSDDLELEPSQVAYWIDIVLGGLIKQSLESKLAKGDTVDPIYIQHEECLIPKLKDSNCLECNNNIFVPLCKSPISLMKDRGVLRVTTQDGKAVDKISLEELDVINNLTFSKPKLSNMVYHREKDRLFLHGIDHRSLDFVQINVWYVPSPKLLDELEDDDTVDISEDILDPLSDLVEEKARRQLFQSAEDEENDSEQDMTPQ